MVETGFGIHANPAEPAGTWDKIVDSFLAARDWEAVDEGNGVKTAVGNAKAPNEVGNVGDVFLVWFGARMIIENQLVRWGKRLIQFIPSKSFSCCKMILVSWMP